MLVPQANPYIYTATVLNVVDGDTIDAMVDLGFRSSVRLRFRLFGINAPETRGEQRPDGLKSKDWLKERISNKEIIINTHKDHTGKYGRYLATIWLDGKSVNQEMVELGLARLQSY